jgi:hypothetical protein
MTHEELKQKERELMAATAKRLGMRYIMDDWARANLRADGVSSEHERVNDILVDVLQVSGTMMANNNAFRDSENRMFAFLTPCNLDFEGEGIQPQINRMKERAKQFVAAVNESGLYNWVDGNLPYRVVYDKLDENMVGITMEITLTPQEGECYG